MDFNIAVKSTDSWNSFKGDFLFDPLRPKLLKFIGSETSHAKNVNWND